MRGFFPMSRGGLLCIGLLLLFALVSFLPFTREVHVAGMALLGWLMAALMVLSPAIALLRLRAARRRDRPPPAVPIRRNASPPSPGSTKTPES